MRPRKVDSQRSFTSLLKAILGGNSNALPFLPVTEVSPSKPITQLPFWNCSPLVMPKIAPPRSNRGVCSKPVGPWWTTALPQAPPPELPK